MDKNHAFFTSSIGEKETFDTVAKHCHDADIWKDYRTRYKKSLLCNMNDIPPYPIQIDFELNGTCNYRCDSCTYRLDYVSIDKEQRISQETFKQIVDTGIPKGLRALRFNYHNEPLLKKDISEYIKYAKQAGIVDTYLSTNGSLLNDEMIASLIDSKLDRIQISIDAFTTETYNKLRRGGDLNKVVENAKKFLLTRNKLHLELPTLRVNFVKQEQNIHELQDFCRFWLEEGADSIGIQDFSEWMNERSDNDYNDVDFQCAIPFNRIVIRYNGDVLPCCTFMSTELVLGNIYNSSVGELWQSPLINELRQLHTTKRGWKNNVVCKKCVKSFVKPKQ